MRRTWILSAVVVSGAVIIGALSQPATVLGAGETAAHVGASNCKKCHLKHEKSWKGTGMAKTFESLKPGQVADKKTAGGLDPAADFTKDEKCLKCHTTGYGTPTGYPAVTAGKEYTPEELARAKLTEGVTCEACHGPGSLYGPFKKDNPNFKVADIVALGAVIPKAETCTACHEAGGCPTMPKDYAFSFEEAVKKDDKIHEHIALKNPH